MSGTQFEVHRLQDGRWTLADVFTTESAAKNQAEALLKRAEVEGVRVVRDWLRGDGMHVEKVLLESVKRGHAEEKMVPGTVELAPVCQDAAELFECAARIVMGRVMRPFLDKFVLTPTELLHSYGWIKKAQVKDNLMMMAVDRVATAQARYCGEESKALGARLHTLIDQVAAWARKAEQQSLPAYRQGEFDKVYRALAESRSEESARRLGLVVLSRRLGEKRSWLGKLELLMAEARNASWGPLAALDGVTADLFATPVAVQDMLGQQRNLAGALHALLDLSEGEWSGKDADPTLATLNELVGEGSLMETQVAVIECVRRQLGGTGSLDRANPDQERELFRTLLGRLVGEEEVIGGPGMAEAAVMRAYRRMQRGGILGKGDALDEVLRCLGNDRLRIAFLLELAQAPMAGEMLAAIRAGMRALLTPVQAVEDLAPGRLSLLRKMEIVSQLYRRILYSALPDEDKGAHADKLDELLSRFLVQQQVIETLDNPADTLAERAVRLVQFCIDGPLTEGKALQMARQRVLSHLRQPNFHEVFIQNMPPAEREHAVRSFHRLLSQAGFN